MDFLTNNAGASSSSTPELTYDVFLSFRGEDTRYGFTGNLYNALCASGIYTFIDDEELPRGEEISRELPKAVEESRILIVVFSENYATSRWCLDELVKILDCKKLNQWVDVLPIFYNVLAGEVRKQEGNFGRVMDMYLHEKGFNHDKVQRWRDALTEVANLSGWPRSLDKYEYQFIQRIVKDVSSKLNRLTPLHIADYLVGIDSHVHEINKLLQTASDDVRILGIYGFGGIGKTTIAKAVYNSLVRDFEGHHSFLDNVTENSKQHNGLVKLQEKLLSNILGNKRWEVDNVAKGIRMIKERLHRKNVLLILDDVDELDLLENLAVRRNSFGKGSIIIITTRDKHLLTSDPDVFVEYKVNKLNLEEARQLFSWHAFKGNKFVADYAEFVNRAIRYADGHPLALKVLGSRLCGESKPVWESTLDKCREIQPDKIHMILKISFDKLDKNEKEIFLDIAFFFKGKNRDDVEAMLQSCKFYPESGIASLINRCLITVDEKNNQFGMHDLLQQMGWEIIREESEKPKNRSRLCFYEDVLEVLGENEGLKTIQGIMLDLPGPKKLHLGAKVFTMMTSLRVLIVRNASFSEGFEYLPSGLMWLDWDNYYFPFSSNSCFEELVYLNIPRSGIILKEPLTKKFKCMINMNLSDCKFIEKVPDISGMPKLKNLNVESCENLVEVHQPIGFHNTLVHLKLSNCRKLKIFPSILKMKSLEVLDLSGCSCLVKVPDISETPNLKKLDFSFCESLIEVHQSVGFHNTLVSINLRFCQKLQKFPSILKMKSLEVLDLSSCSCLGKVPDISETPNLKRLDFSLCESLIEVHQSVGFHNTLFRLIEVHESVGFHNTLVHLELSGCRNLKIFSGILKMKSLEVLDLSSCSCLEKVPDISEMPNLKNLNFSLCKSLIEVHQSVGFHNTLVCLNLNDCPNLQIFPSSLHMKSLEELDLSGCSRLDKFPNILGIMESMKRLYLEGTAIKELHSSIEYLISLDELRLSCRIKDCPKVGKFMVGKGDDRQPMCYNIRCTENSEEIRDPHLNVPNDNLSTSMRLSMLSKLKLKNCSLPNLDFLNTLGCFDTLVFLDLSKNNFVTIPKCIYKFHRLENLELRSCKLLQKIPMLPPMLCKVYANNCISLNSESRNRLLSDYQGITISETETILPGLDMAHVDSDVKGEGVLGLPLEDDDVESNSSDDDDEEDLGSTSKDHSNSSNEDDDVESNSYTQDRRPKGIIISETQTTLPDEQQLLNDKGKRILDDREGWPPSVRDNTEHSPLPGSEMDHRVTETTLDTALGPLGWPYIGVQSTVNDGFDLGSSSLPKRRRSS